MQWPVMESRFVLSVPGSEIYAVRLLLHHALPVRAGWIENTGAANGRALGNYRFMKEIKTMLKRQARSVDEKKCVLEAL